VENGDVPEKPHVEETAQRQLRTPKPAMDKPIGGRQVLGRPAPAHLDNGNSIALLGKPVRSDTAPETRTNNYEVKIKLFVLPPHVFFIQTEWNAD
jgi:hypothetical protein